MLCPQPCTKMPPPPCELLVTLKPSMLDGLHKKLLGYGFVLLDGSTQSLTVKSVVPAGNTSEAQMTAGSLVVNFTPLASTVMPAPSYAPIKLGSINCSARLPLSVAVQPTVVFSGKATTENCIGELQLNVPDG